jgi:glucosamine kinase
MDDSPNTMVLAIDGGGTRCRVGFRNGPDVIAIETGAANVATDFDGGVAHVIEGLRALALRSGRSVETLAQLPAFVGLAGVMSSDIAERLRGVLPFSNVRIADDRPAALRGALGMRDGVLAHCGTGSFYGVQIAGRTRLSGGWGPVLGDEASAQWIGRAALRGALKVVDGRAARSGLASLLLDRFGGAPGIVGFAGSARPSDFGALAPLVTDCAARGDALGRHVMAAGARAIAASLVSIGWVSGQAICLTGGIGPHFGPYLPDVMRADIVPPEGDPLAGALSLAQDLALEVTG